MACGWGLPWWWWCPKAGGGEVPDTLLFLRARVVRAGPTPPAPSELEEAPTVDAGGRDLERERAIECPCIWEWEWDGECIDDEWMGDGVCRVTAEK